MVMIQWKMGTKGQMPRSDIYRLTSYCKHNAQDEKAPANVN